MGKRMETTIKQKDNELRIHKNAHIYEQRNEQGRDLWASRKPGNWRMKETIDWHNSHDHSPCTRHRILSREMATSIRNTRPRGMVWLQQTPNTRKTYKPWIRNTNITKEEEQLCYHQQDAWDKTFSVNKTTPRSTVWEQTMKSRQCRKWTKSSSGTRPSMIHDQWSKTSQLKTKQPCRNRGGTSDQHDGQLQETHNAQMFLQRYLTLRLTEEHKVTNTQARTP